MKNILVSAADFDADDRNAGKRAEQNSAQRISERDAVASFKRFQNKGTSFGIVIRFDSRNIRSFYFNHLINPPI